MECLALGKLPSSQNGVLRTPGSTIWHLPDAEVWGQTFQHGPPDYGWTNHGQLEKESVAGRRGARLHADNINACFRLTTPTPPGYVEIDVEGWGGNLNLVLNGQLANFEDFTQPTNVGGVVVSFRLLRPQAPRGGTFTLHGEMVEKELIIHGKPLVGKWGHVAIGGQELYITRFCWGNQP
jgi:hypothetical protein